MTLKQLIARQKKIRKMKADRYTYREIGKEFGISAQRAEQIAKHDYSKASTPSKTKK